MVMNPSGEELDEPTPAGPHDDVDEQAEAPVSAPTAEQWRAIEELAATAQQDGTY